MGRRNKHILPGNQFETFGYDLAGNLIRYTNFNSVVITNQYDELNRLTNRTSINGYEISYTYTLTGQRQTMADASGTQSYAYDARDRLLTNATPAGTLSYQYDENGNVKNITSSTANGTLVTYQYDALNRLTNVVDARLTGTQNTAYHFDAVGNLRNYTYPNGVTNLYQYDSLNRLTNLTWKLTAAALGDFSYQLGLSGNRTNLIEMVAGVSRTNRWAYDPLYRLTNEVLLAASGSGTNAYTYDNVGNRLTRTTNGFTTPFTAPTNQTFNFDKSDRLDNDSNPDTASTLFDANGNTTNYAGAFRYDVENRLTNANNGAVIIVYNGDGLRVKKITFTKTNLYLVDTRNPSGYAQVLEELAIAGATTNLSCAYTYGLDLISQRQPGVTTNFYGYDGHGSVRFLLTLAGSVTNTYVYDAYGMLLSSTGTITNNYRYCGEQFDADLGFYYLRARYFDPNIGRFQTMDTFQGNNSDPLSLHKYLYCHDNPVMGTDPSGLKIIVDGGPVFEAIVNKDLKRIKEGDPALKSMVDELEKSPNEHHIRPYYDDPHFWLNGNSNDAGPGKYGSTTFFDPANWYIHWGDLPVDPVVALAHELRHALSRDRGNVALGLIIINVKDPRWNGVKYDEAPAVTYENLMRRVVGAQHRTGYIQIETYVSY